MGFNPFANNPVDFARAVSCPALFFHGARDTRARISEGSNVYRAVPGPHKRFVSFPELGHEPMVLRGLPNTCRVVVGWLRVVCD